MNYEVCGIALKEWAVARHDIGDNDTWKPDGFKWYVLVSTTKEAAENGMPILAVSFMTVKDDTPGPIIKGTARALYKALAELPLSPGHMAYVGFELGKAETSAYNNLPYSQS